MSQSTEEIEAKLVAYIEGEIDEAGRAEIEKHLASNPNHRALLEDLRIGRNLLRELPRASAPPEILEAVQQHLERKLLLDEESADVIASIRPSLWPRVMTIAAVLLLSGTLGLLIWSMLPSQSQISPELAAVREARDLPGSVGHEPAAVGGGEAASAARPAVTLDTTAPSPADGVAAPGEGPIASAGAVARAPSLPAAESIAGGETGGPLPPSLPTPDITVEPPVLVLLADDSRAAVDELSRFAVANDLHLEPISTRDFDGGRGGALDALEFGDRSRAVAGGAPATAPAEERPVVSVPAGSMLANAGRAAAESGGEESIYAFRGISRAQAEVIAQTLSRQSTPANRVAAQQLPAVEQQRYSQYARPQQLRRDADRVLKPAGSVEKKEQETGKDVLQQNDLGGPATMNPRPAEPRGVNRRGGIIAAGDRLFIRIAHDGDIASAEHTVTVGEEGKVSIPGVIQDVEALGLTPAELEGRIAELLTRDKAGAAPRVTVADATQDESTLTDLVIVVRQNLAVPAVSPAAVPDETGSTRAKSPPATQPATAPG